MGVFRDPGLSPMPPQTQAFPVGVHIVSVGTKTKAYASLPATQPTHKADLQNHAQWLGVGLSWQSPRQPCAEANPQHSSTWKVKAGRTEVQGHSPLPLPSTPFWKQYLTIKAIRPGLCLPVCG